MKKKIYIFGAALVLVVGLGVGSLTAGGFLEGSTPGGPGDPLVTQSYVDMRFNELLQLINNLGAGAQTAAQATYVPVFLSAGSILFAGEGTELILRSGEARAHVPGPDGIINVTIGQDLPAGAELSRNHLLIVPREDGRGVLAVTDVWLVVKGGYRIVNP